MSLFATLAPAESGFLWFCRSGKSQFCVGGGSHKAHVCSADPASAFTSSRVLMRVTHTQSCPVMHITSSGMYRVGACRGLEGVTARSESSTALRLRAILFRVSIFLESL